MTEPVLYLLIHQDVHDGNLDYRAFGDRASRLTDLVNEWGRLFIGDPFERIAEDLDAGDPLTDEVMADAERMLCEQLSASDQYEFVYKGVWTEEVSDGEASRRRFGQPTVAYQAFERVAESIAAKQRPF